MLMQNGNNARKTSSVLLRDDHIVLLAIDGFMTLHASFKKWRTRRRTLRALANLDERQLRDIGLTHDEALVETTPTFLSRHKSYSALAALGDSQLCNLSELGLQVRRKTRRAAHQSLSTRYPLYP